MTSHGNHANDGKVRLATFLHPRFWFCCVPADVSRHFSLSAHFSRFRFALYSNWNLNFPVNHILQVSCDWILCCDWYALHDAGRQVALWPYPRPFPSVRNRVWTRETIAHPSCQISSFLFFQAGPKTWGHQIHFLLTWVSCELITSKCELTGKMWAHYIKMSGVILRKTLNSTTFQTVTIPRPSEPLASC